MTLKTTILGLETYICGMFINRFQQHMARPHVQLQVYFAFFEATCDGVGNLSGQGKRFLGFVS